MHLEAKKHAYKKDGSYWIDIELQDANSLSIRIALCNPMEPVLQALDDLLLFLYCFRGSTLIDPNTKQTFSSYNDIAKKSINDSYNNRRKLFQEMYGNFVAAISSNEFYQQYREWE